MDAVTENPPTRSVAKNAEALPVFERRPDKVGPPPAAALSSEQSSSVSPL
ncbi:hypothetical protein [Arthrobacter sp. C9C5]|nr:hypothetical protein [Arthrobacter sp. C9C5]NUU29983.1 hypothetical protein [Arthrobacter sp. C9C5]